MKGAFAFMDVFVEYLVKRKNTGKTIALKILIIFGTILLCLVLLTLCFIKSIHTFSFVFFCLIAGVIYGAWWLMRSFKVEYEYIVTNGEMDVDKIMGQQKRKRLISINFRNIEIMAPMGGEHKGEFENQSIPKTIDASALKEEKGAYFIVMRHDRQGMVRIIFTPNEKIIKSAQSVAPRKVFTN